LKPSYVLIPIVLVALVGGTWLVTTPARSPGGSPPVLAEEPAVSVDEEPPVASSEESTPASREGPRLAFDETSVDFGAVPLDTLDKHDFVYRNTGDSLLVLQGQPQIEAVEGCWPPKPVVGAMTLKPGQSSKLSISTMMHEGMDGPHLFRITVKSNDRVSPETVIFAKAVFGP
jgi:hypothetical protein